MKTVAKITLVPLFLFVSLLCTDAFSQDAPPEPVINDGGISHPDSRKYEGDNCREVGENMPDEEVGKCNYKFNYNYQDKLVSCDPKDADQGEGEGWIVVLKPDPLTVTLDVDIEMPTWDGYEDAEKKCQEAWDDFYARLLEHENGHKAIAETFAKILASELSKVRGTGCAEKKQDAANEASADLKEKMKATYNGVMLLHELAQETYHLIVGDTVDLNCPDD